MKHILSFFIILCLFGCSSFHSIKPIQNSGKKEVLSDGKDKSFSMNTKEFNNFEELQTFAENSSGFGGELKILWNGIKMVYIADLQRTSGVVSTEAYIFPTKSNSL